MKSLNTEESKETINALAQLKLISMRNIFPCKQECYFKEEDVPLPWSCLTCHLLAAVVRTRNQGWLGWWPGLERGQPFWRPPGLCWPVLPLDLNIFLGFREARFPVRVSSARGKSLGMVVETSAILIGVIVHGNVQISVRNIAYATTITDNLENHDGHERIEGSLAAAKFREKQRFASVLGKEKSCIFTFRCEYSSWQFH
ncbi:hypothetical protein BD289DRAFT_438961 [Coniella lustricola]|uniref:Uncharacterized protein n=1 Tax=Coniella lustricola TaxID=2025994 RepID=A0A2T3A281_9PEZI|nr:hypothetical protein BD289DRAFT_438961 [Coniella lustricola]